MKDVRGKSIENIDMFPHALLCVAILYPDVYESYLKYQKLQSDVARGALQTFIEMGTTLEGFLQQHPELKKLISARAELERRIDKISQSRDW